MKKIIITLAAATICFTACKKQPTPAPSTVAHTVTEADFTGSKANVMHLMKKTKAGMYVEYDLVIKQVSENTYAAALRIIADKRRLIIAKETERQGVDVNPTGITLTAQILNEKTGGKNEGTSGTELFKAYVDLTKVEAGKIITFPEFQYKGSLAGELLDVRSVIALEKGDVKVYDETKFNLGGQDMTVVGSKIDVRDGKGTIFTDGATVNGGKGNMETSFGLYMNGGIPEVVLQTGAFVLSTGHTVTQDPKVTKAKIAGDNGYVTIVISGDPAQKVQDLYYKPAPVQSDTKDAAELPVMKFVATHSNQINGMQRFISTQTWEEVYGKTAIKSGPTTGFVLGQTYGLKY